MLRDRRYGVYRFAAGVSKIYNRALLKTAHVPYGIFIEEGAFPSQSVQTHGDEQGEAKISRRKFRHGRIFYGIIHTMKLENPFLIRGYAGPDYFCDREAETAQLVEAVKNGRDVTLVAPRRYGKTGLIHNAFGRLSKTHATVYLDIFAINDLTAFVQAFSSAVVGVLDSKAKSVGRRILSFFKSCRPTITPREDGSLEFSFNIAATAAKATLKETFDYIAAHGQKIVIAVDEFQQVREFPETGVEALLRSYIQFVPNAHFIFAGSKKHMMDEMFVSPKGSFYQSTQLMALGPIDESAYSDFAARFFHSAGRAFEPAAFSHIYNRFEGITWYVQCILNRIWSKGAGLESESQADKAVDELVEEAGVFYQDLLRSQTSAEQSILKAIGKDGVVGAISSSDFLSRHSLPSASTVRSAVANLKDRDLVYQTDRGYVVYDRFFGLWLARLV